MTEATLADLVEPGRKICYGIVQPGAAHTDGIPILRVNNFGASGLSTDDVLRVDPSIAQKYPRSKLHGGELLVTLVGSVGQVAIAPTNLAGWNVARAVGVVPIADPVMTKWASYVLRSGPAQAFLGQRANTTVQTTVNLRDLALLPIPLLPRDELEAVIVVLSALDDKIELNRRMSETLEAQARALFRDWFVDFGPVKAKMAGDTPYLAPDLWSLFPNRLDDDGVPEGWASISVGDVASLRGGKQLLKSEIADNGPVPVYGGAGIMGFTKDGNAEGYVITVGRVGAYCGQFFSHRGTAWVNNNASLIAPNQGVSGEWLFLALKELDIETIRKGAAQPFVSNGDIAKLKLIWPSTEVMEAFLDLAGPLIRRQEVNLIGNKALGQTRDLLLPKLMSGEIRVGEVSSKELSAA